MTAHVERIDARDRIGVTVHDASFNKILKKARAKFRPVSRQRDAQAV
jgi:hypothetical protein